MIVWIFDTKDLNDVLNDKTGSDDQRWSGEGNTV